MIGLKVHFNSSTLIRDFDHSGETEMTGNARHDLLTVGEAAARCGVAASAIRYYESIGLIPAVRTGGNQRRFHRSVIRRISVIRVAQSLGLTLDEIRKALEELPESRTPTKKDWARLASSWRSVLDERIHSLERLRDDLTGCIGCGCLSLKACSLFNPDDSAAEEGPGPHFPETSE